MDDTGNIMLDQRYTDADVWCEWALKLNAVLFDQIMEALNYQGDPAQYELRDESIRGRKVVAYVEEGTKVEGTFACCSAPKIHAFNADQACNDTAWNPVAMTSPGNFLYYKSCVLCHVEGFIFLFGTDNATCSLQVQKFDAEKGVWSAQCHSSRAGTVGNTATVVQDKIILPGGMLVTKDSLYKLDKTKLTDRVVGFNCSSGAT